MVVEEVMVRRQPAAWVEGTAEAARLVGSEEQWELHWQVQLEPVEPPPDF